MNNIATEISNTAKKSYNAAMEILRGWVAIIVLIGHILLFRQVFLPDAAPGFYFHPGHYSVLVFFMLSGYVIGLAYPKDAENTMQSYPKWIKKYLWRRFLRIYPIYFVALLLAYSVLGELRLPSSFLIHLCFGQEAFSPTISSNSPLWSLHYEMLYYILFVFIYYFRKKISLLFLIFVSIILSFGRTCIVGEHWLQIAFGYATGYAFWLTGLWVAWYLPQRQTAQAYGKIIAACLLAFTFSVWNILFVGENILETQQLIFAPTGASIGYPDILYLPSVFLLVLIPANASFRYFSHLLTLVFILSAAHIFYSFFYFQYLFARESHLLGLLCFFLAIIFWHLPNSQWLSFLYKKLILLGGISYGVYALHFPIMHIVGKYIHFSSSNKYALTVMCVFVITFLLAYILEKQLQPRLKKWIG